MTDVAKASKRLPPAQRALARLTGARLCFGSPVQQGGRTVIPVASVRSAGGWGFGNGPDGDNGARTGGGGGGALDARPVGFIELGPDGARFQRIDDGRRAVRVLAGASLGVLIAGRIARRRRASAAIAGPPPRRRLRRGALGAG